MLPRALAVYIIKPHSSTLRKVVPFFPTTGATVRALAPISHANSLSFQTTSSCTNRHSQFSRASNASFSSQRVISGRISTLLTRNFAEISSILFSLVPPVILSRIVCVRYLYYDKPWIFSQISSPSVCN